MNDLPPLSGPAGQPFPPPPAPPAPEAAPEAPPLERLPRSDAGTWDVLGAAWKAETIRTDAWDYTEKRRREIAMEMFWLLPEAARPRIEARFKDWEDPASFEAIVIAEAAAERQRDPQRWAGFPASEDELRAQVDAKRKADLTEAQNVLDQPGHGLAEFIGTSARDLTDQTSLAMLPLGAGAGSALKVIATEALLGAAGNVVTIPRENRVADELGLPHPDPLLRALEGAALGGGLSALALGAVKGLSMWASRRAGVKAATPKGGDALQTEIDVTAAEAALRGDRTVAETLAPDQRSRQDSPAGPVEFDYRASGSASPRTNRVGYVYGKLLELGYPPHVAAGLTGNFMAESGPSLNTRAMGDGGAAYGIAQWNDRRPALEAFAAKRGTSPDDLDTQIAFVDYELKGRERAAYDRIMATQTAAEAARIVSDAYERPGTPNMAHRIAYAEAIARQYDAGEVPRWDGASVLPEGGAAYVPTTRGYTGEGQVSTGAGSRIDVSYEVVDAASLLRASGDLQPRDRSRTASDAWIADTSARLDPQQLMPAPTADRGAPIVGPDNVIESGNGRYAAIVRAYELHPERAAAYRAQIEAAGFAVPEGAARPVLIARRTSDLSPEARRAFVIDAQDSGVAQLTPTELARASARAMTAPVLGRLDPGQPLAHEANAGFVRETLAALPRSARNAMFDSRGLLNRQGERQLREALFARAWNAPDIIELMTEAEAGPLKSLLEALDRAAPAWAALKAEIEAGLVRPEMDISGHVLEAMRLIATARKLSQREGLPIGRALAELLDEVDLIEGALSPLTAALVRKFWRAGRAAPADEIAAFLTRYADDARKAGATGGLFGGPSPRDVLTAIDPEGFGNLPEDMGQARGAAAPPARQVDDAGEPGFDQGAASPEAEAADAQIAADLAPPEPPPAAAPPAPAPDALAAFADDGFAALPIALPDGSNVTVAELLDDLKSDEAFSAFLQACAIIPGATP